VPLLHVFWDDCAVQNPGVVVGEAINFPGAPDFLRSHGVEVVILDQPTLVKMMGDFIRAKPELWNEDIAE